MVLVTGADGFIGSHLTERLVESGAEVRAFCFYNSNGSWGWLDEAPREVKRSLDVRLGDIRDARFVEEACRGVDTVFHLAALIAIPFSYRAPESFVDTNINGTLNILEGARRAGCRRVINTSTSEVYGTPADLPIRETHPLQGQSPYSASKIAADKLCEAYHCSFGLPVVTLRPFNTYGPRQSMRAVLPTILVQLLSGKRSIALGNVEPRRDLTFVADTVEGFVRCAEAKGVEGQVIQLGTGRTESIREVFETACRVLGRDAVIKTRNERVRPDKSEVMVLQSDPALARKRLGWKARVSLEEGIRRTAAWIEPRLGRYAADRYHV
ncbi:MAG TPA: NAD-dependent dehydratase [Syntrophus sp. (in: bacteria)]|nr:NAD-dependent dehydratase [Syntrophus sp. (in: bacteria)]